MKTISILCVAAVLCVVIFASISVTNYERDKKAQDEKVLPTPMPQDEHEVNTKAKSSYAENSEAADALKQYLERKDSVAETLKHCVAELQKKPDDQALREKIIKLALTLKPRPATPNEAIELKGAVKHVIDNAKSESDYADVVEAYKKLSLAVPWAAGVYFNLAKMQEKIGKTGDAITSYSFYLMAAPEAEDANKVREQIGALKYVMEKESKTPESNKEGPIVHTEEQWKAMRENSRRLDEE